MDMYLFCEYVVSLCTITLLTIATCTCTHIHSGLQVHPCMTGPGQVKATTYTVYSFLDSELMCTQYCEKHVSMPVNNHNHAHDHQVGLYGAVSSSVHRCVCVRTWESMSTWPSGWSLWSCELKCAQMCVCVCVCEKLRVYVHLTELVADLEMSSYWQDCLGMERDDMLKIGGCNTIRCFTSIPSVQGCR